MGDAAGQVDLEQHHRREDNKRTGSLWTASAHIIAAVIGSGFLVLPWAVTQLGWIAGPFVVLFFSGVTCYTSSLLAECYRPPEPGKSSTYMAIARNNLDAYKVKICGVVQHLYLFGTSINYTVAASATLKSGKMLNCFRARGEDSPCVVSREFVMFAFCVVQIFLSQIPDLDGAWWLSLVSTIMSLIYASITISLGVAKIAENGELKGSLSGISSDSIMQKISLISQATGVIACAFPFCLILVEIQDTIKEGPPPSVSKTMKKAMFVSAVATTVLYVSCICFGYAAFGEISPAEQLTGFGFYNPSWVQDIANAAFVIFLLGAYQLFCQPLFAFVEKTVQEWFPNNEFLRAEVAIPIAGLRSYKLRLFRLVWRTNFVIIVTVIAMFVPSFHEVARMLGVFAFWPMNIYYPVEIYISEKQIEKWSWRWIWLQILIYSCLMLSIPSKVANFYKLVT